MDFSVIGREASRLIKDVIDQSFGTHFFGKNVPAPQAEKPTSAQTNPVDGQKLPGGTNSENGQTVKEQEQKIKAEAVRAELNAAIAAQRQKRQAEQQQVEQLRQEAIVKAGPQALTIEAASGAPDLQKSVEKLDSKVLE